MKRIRLTIKHKLNLGFLGLSLFLLLASGIGIKMVAEVTASANEVIEKKIPIKDATNRLLSDIQRSISLSRKHLIDLQHSQEIVDKLEHSMDDIDTGILMLLYGAESDRFKELTADRFDATHMPTNVHAATGQTLAITEAMQQEFEILRRATLKLSDTHTKLTHFNFKFDTITYGLKTFLLTIDVELGRWLAELEDAAKYDAEFKGTTHVDQSRYGRWYKIYIAHDKRLASLLKGVHRQLDKTYKVASQINQVDTKKAKVKVIGSAIKYIRVSRRNLVKVQNYVIPIVDKLVTEEQQATVELEAAETRIEALLNEMIKEVDKEISLAKAKADDTEQLATQLLMATIVIGLITSLLLGWFVSNSVSSGLRQINHAVKDLHQGDGDLTRRLEINTHDELETLANDFNLFIDQIQHIVNETKLSAIAVAESNTELAAKTERISVSFTEQSAKVENITRAIESINDSSGHVVDLVGTATSKADQASKATLNGKQELDRTSQSIGHIKQNVEHLASAMTGLEQAVGNINEITNKIVSIAGQTNLLALNAAIEAARAGEQGRGFAVVADEVRTLSAQTHRATEEIERIVTTLKKEMHATSVDMSAAAESVEQGVRVIGHAQTSFDEIIQSVEEITQASHNINHVMREQNRHIEHVTTNVHEMDAEIDQTAEAMSQIAQTTSEISRKAENLNKLASSFKT